MLLQDWICTGLLACLLPTTTSANMVPAHDEGDASWPYHKYRTANFTPPWLKITRYRHTYSEGFLFIAPDGPTAFQQAPVIMNLTDAELVWNGPLGHAFDFGVQQFSNSQVLAYWNGTAFPEPVGRGNGVVEILDQSYERVGSVSLAGNFKELSAGVEYPSNVDLHEAFITISGNIIVTANNVTRADLTSVGGSKDGWIVNCFVYEIDIVTNDIFFEWSALDHLDELPLSTSLYPLGSEGFTGSRQDLAWDYFHINSVSPFQNGYIISSRYLCSAIAITRKGRVKWRLQGRDGGDFELGKGTNFCYQHDVRTNPVRPEDDEAFELHMYDNSNCPIDNGKVPSSGLVLNINPRNMSVSLEHRFKNPASPIYSTAQGSMVPVLPVGTSLVGNGWVPIAEEFNKYGEVVQSIQYGIAESNPSGGFRSSARGTRSYRAFMSPWIACPLHLPNVIAECTGNSTAIYVSWNGATEVMAWRFYGGESADDLEYLSTEVKNGFETVAHVRRDLGYVLVVPVFRPAGYDEEKEPVYNCAYAQVPASEVVTVRR